MNQNSRKKPKNSLTESQRYRGVLRVLCASVRDVFLSDTIAEGPREPKGCGTNRSNITTSGWIVVRMGGGTRNYPEESEEMAKKGTWKTTSYYNN